MVPDTGFRGLVCEVLRVSFLFELIAMYVSLRNRDFHKHVRLQKVVVVAHRHAALVVH